MVLMSISHGVQCALFSGQVGMYRFVIGNQEMRVCSVQCKLILLQRARDQGLGWSDAFGAGSSLPEGWELRVNAQGRAYYLDHNTCASYWTKPADEV